MIALMLASGRTLGLMVAAFALIAGVETLIPLHRRQDWNRIHVAPNLVLTVFTVATGVVFNAALVLALMALEARGFGLLHWWRLPPLAAVALVIATLDLATYALHVSMHKLPLLWRVHRVHHADPVLDVTTSIRQHPVEGLLRYLAMGIPACILGASPGAFAVYRAWSLFNGLGEHANIKIPRWLDRLLVRFFVTPDMHKIHHARTPALADTNYGNIFSFFDRAFSTFTVSDEGAQVRTGLDGFDDRTRQTTGALLALPFR
jgi:sterol desaturase/sphingolipid hydroxylase (fatty acid hydroxylase superfamily)